MSNCPKERQLCVFRRNNEFVLGYLDKGWVVKYGGGSLSVAPLMDFQTFQPVLGERGKIIKVKSNTP